MCMSEALVRIECYIIAMQNESYQFFEKDFLKGYYEILFKLSPLKIAGTQIVTKKKQTSQNVAFVKNKPHEKYSESNTQACLKHHTGNVQRFSILVYKR